MEIKTFFCNPLHECCYLAWDGTGACVIVDPGCYGAAELSLIESFVEGKNLRPEKILLTHSHFDHILGLEAVASRWKLDVYMHPDDREQLVRSADWCARLGLEFKPFTGRFVDIADGDKITFGDTTLEVLATPGHTQGGVCFYCRADGVIFTGDTLFAGSIGRTDHPGGNYEQLIDSIFRKLLPLDGEVMVLPGHGGSSSIGYERSTNPFLQP